ncbi:MAG TPA: DUF397 domain-containing protein [Streptosporangiaceae bacterium]|jgi:hypothetical protein|nr:DUF397 domain-containing protein [Streptosporangiaceae bacterium]
MDITGAPQGASSLSAADGEGDGVEVATEPGSKEGSDHVITVRNARDPDGPKLVFTPDEWQAFVAGVKDGEFDLA